MNFDNLNFDDLNFEDDEILGGSKKFIQILCFEYDNEEPSYEIKYIYSYNEYINLYYYYKIDLKYSFFFTLLENNIIEIDKIYDMNDNYFVYCINENKKKIKLQDFTKFLNYYPIEFDFKIINMDLRIKQLFCCDCIIDNYIYGIMTTIDKEYVIAYCDFFIKMDNSIHFLENECIRMILTKGKYYLEDEYSSSTL
jgi:hypothetical protein